MRSVGHLVQERFGSAGRIRFEIQGVVCTLVLALMIFLVLYPVLLVVLSSFQITHPGSPPVFGLAGWRVAFGEPGMRDAIFNTFALLVTRQLISFPIAIFIAWLLARTDLPGWEWLEFMFWLCFFLPSLSVTLGWILVLDPEYGMANQLWNWWFGTKKGPFNIYSFWGIIWAHIGHNAVAVKVMLLTPAFRNMDAALEEASAVAGAGTLKTLLRILVPIMTPVLLVVVVLAVLSGLQTFEIEMILGAPIGLHVYSTMIYKLMNQEPPLFGPAMALGSVVLLTLLPLIALQRFLIGRRQFTTVTGRYQPRRIPLGRWKYPALIWVGGVTLILTALPMAFLLTGTFMSLFGFFHIEKAWTVENWTRVLHDPLFLSSLRNTLVMASGAAVMAVGLFSLVAYIIVKTKFTWKMVLDFICWIPSAVPGILFSMGLLSLFLSSMLFRPLYGSVWLLILATVISSTTLGTQIIKGNLLQLGSELEEASRALGASWATTYRRIVVPLIFPTLLMVGVVNFIHAARDISTVALLATSRSRTLALLQLDFMVAGHYESAAVVATLVMLFTTGVAVTSRFLGLKIGIRG
jgi:iron(III) transport system permease protein